MHKAGFYLISCSKASNSGVLKNPPGVISRPSHSFLMVKAAPCYIMGDQMLLQVGRIDVDHIALPHNTGCGFSVAEWNTETAALIIDKTVKRDISLRAQLEGQCRIHLQCMDLLNTTVAMDLFTSTT